MKNVCVLILGNELPYSETFIKAHVEHLPGKVLSCLRLPKPFEKINYKLTGVEGIIKVIILNIIIFFRNIVKSYKVKRFLNENKIDVILAEYGIAGVKALPFCKKYKIPLVVHFHGYDAYKRDVIKEFGNQYRILFAYAKAIVVVSKDMEKQLLNLGVHKSKLFYNVYGVNTKLFSGGNKSQNSNQLIAVGRFVNKKAPYLTILAFQKALVKVPDAKLYMIGSGELFQICKNIVSSLGLDNSIILNEALPHEEIAGLLQKSRAFVQHSIVAESGDSEGTPNTILEAQAAGLPVISTSHAGTKDVVIHNVTGYLVDEGDINTMSEYMIKLLLNPIIACELGESGRNNVLSNYTVEQSIKKLRDIIEEI